MYAKLVVFAYIRGLSTGIYTTNSPEACHYILEDCKANIVVVENQKQLDKILEVYFLVHEYLFIRFICAITDP